MKIRIKKFKKIRNVELELSPINIFIGANNSGKSSFIQGIQFAISACQTLDLLGARWVKSITRTLSLDSREFLYTPTSDIAYLYHGKRLSSSRKKEDRNWIEFTFEDGATSKLKVSRGKNGGFTTVLEGKKLGMSLSSVEKPFCVYVPGIAGIPVREKYEVPIAVKKSATRGDSNNYLRNILLTINVDEESWKSFSSSVKNVYGDIELAVEFDSERSEFIEIYVKKEGVTLPLDSVGTGLLQVIQIFAYIEYFSPKVILLDEPDSHIHPTKQKVLANELVNRAIEQDNLKIVFSTHSRYILEALDGRATVFHFQEGKALPNVAGSSVLLDIGAADADYLFSKKHLKYVIATEDKVDNIDEKKSYLKKFMLANGLKEDEFVLHSYEGCTKVDFAKILQGFVQKQIPTARVIVHIDRDQKVDGDRELIKLKRDCESRGLLLFVTEFQEIESYFTRPEHVSNVFDITLEEAEKKYQTFLNALEEETKRKIANFLLRDRKELICNKGGREDYELLEKHKNEWYQEYAEELTPGKEMLGMFKDYAQRELKLDPNKILDISEGLQSIKLQSLIEKDLAH